MVKRLLYGAIRWVAGGMQKGLCKRAFRDCSEWLYSADISELFLQNQGGR